MFSGRIHWDLKPNRLTQAIQARRAAGARILDLTESNPTRAGLAYPAAVVKAFEDPRMLLYEPSPAGLAEARHAVAEYYAARGCAVDPGRILLTASTSEAYSYLFKLLCSPGDQVLVPRPSYPLFEFLAALESVEVRQYPLHYEGGWSMDLDALRDAIHERTRAIVVVNPNNPTGSFVKPVELGALVQLCADCGLALVSDEVFSDYAFGSRTAGMTSLVNVGECLTFSMSGLSKVAALPQMKLGWIVVGGPSGREAYDRLEWIADTFLSVGTPVQWAARALLAAGDGLQQQIRERTAAHRELAADLFAGTAASLLPVEGGWYATIQMPRIRSEEEWALELLERDGVLVQPGFFYDFESEAYLIVSLLTAPEIFSQGLAAIRRRL